MLNLGISKLAACAAILSCVSAAPAQPAPDSPQASNLAETKAYFNNLRSKMNIVKSTSGPDGLLIDWIPIDSQGTIATPPDPPKNGNMSSGLKPVLETGIERGPEGTVPVLRLDLDNLDPNISLQQRLSKGRYAGLPGDKNTTNGPLDGDAGTHWYASSAQPITNYGGAGTFSTFAPFVQSSSDFSLLQTAVIRYNVPVSGGGTTSQTCEAGWINYPAQVGSPHLFSFFTTNGYSADGDNIGGWNRDQAGWVQTDSTIFPGTPFSTIAIDGGTQYDLTIRYNLHQGNWWLYVLDRYIGYYPANLYTQGTNSADTLETQSSQINFYGEIFQTETAETTTDMGSGEFPETGFGHSAYIHNIVYTDGNNDDQGYDGSAQLIQSDTSRYRIDPTWNSGTSWGSFAYLGGPGAGGQVGS